MLNVISNFFFIPTKKRVVLNVNEHVKIKVDGKDYPIKLKNWSDAHLPPLAWNRVLLKLLPNLKNEDIWLYEIIHPSSTYTISNRAYQLIQQTIFKVYKVISK